MKYPQHHDPLAIIAVLEHVACIKDAEHKLPIFGPLVIGPTECGKISENSGLLYDRRGDDWRQSRMTILHERGETVQVGQSPGRPFDFYARQGLKSGVPHVPSQRTTSS